MTNAEGADGNHDKMEITSSLTEKQCEPCEETPSEEALSMGSVSMAATAQAVPEMSVADQGLERQAIVWKGATR